MPQHMFFSGNIEIPVGTKIPDGLAGYITSVPTMTIFTKNGEFGQHFIMVEVSEEMTGHDGLMDFIKKIGRDLKAHRIFGRVDRDEDYHQIEF
jgi:hypothetical protein